MNKSNRSNIWTLDDFIREYGSEDLRVDAFHLKQVFWEEGKMKHKMIVNSDNIADKYAVELEENKRSIELNTKEYYIELIKIFLNHIEERKEMYTSIMINNRNSIMMDILLSVVNNDVLKRLELDDIKTKIPREVIAKFYLGGVINIGVEWINGTSKYTKEDLINYLNILIPEDILSL